MRVSSPRRSAPSAQLRLRSGTAQLVWPATGGAVVMVLLVEPSGMREAARVSRSLPGILSLIAICRDGRELEDGADSIEWIADHAAQLGADGRRLILAGLDGAAAVAAALTIRARDRGWPVVEHLLLIRPRPGVAERQLAGIPVTTADDGAQAVDGLCRALRLAG